MDGSLHRDTKAGRLPARRGVGWSGGLAAEGGSQSSENAKWDRTVRDGKFPSRTVVAHFGFRHFRSPPPPLSHNNIRPRVETAICQSAFPCVVRSPLDSHLAWAPTYMGHTPSVAGLPQAFDIGALCVHYFTPCRRRRVRLRRRSRHLFPPIKAMSHNRRSRKCCWQRLIVASSTCFPISRGGWLCS